MWLSRRTRGGLLATTALAGALAAAPVGLAPGPDGLLALSTPVAHARGGDDHGGNSGRGGDDSGGRSGRGGGDDSGNDDHGGNSGRGGGDDRGGDDHGSSSGRGGDDGGNDDHGGNSGRDGGDDHGGSSGRGGGDDRGGDDHGGNSGRGGGDDRGNDDHGGNSGRGGGDDHDDDRGGNGTKVEVDGDKIEVTFPDGTRQEIENGRFEAKDAAGRTVVERPATSADAARLRSAAAGGAVGGLSVRSNGARVESSGRGIEVTYADGWKEEIENGRYELKDPDDNSVVERAATGDDRSRLESMLAF
jgi:hypothetical protein